MITHIKIDGFKSFQNFEMSFSPLTVIAGVNASGKSNLFDALNLLSRLAETDLKTAFSEQRGNPDELFTQYDESSFAEEMMFTVDMLVNRNVKDNWGGSYELNNTRLRYCLRIGRSKNAFGFQALIVKHESLEKIKYEDDGWLSQFPKIPKKLWKSQKGGGSKEPFIRTYDDGGTVAIKIRQDGGGHGKATPASAVSQTVLGGINSVDFPHAFAAKEEMRNWRFLQLNPEDLREPTKQDAGIRDQITSSGKNMAAALFRIKQQDSYSIVEISRKLNALLPGFSEVDVFDDKAERQYVVKLRGEDNKWFSSRVLSEGTLRILLLCILSYDDEYSGVLSFEEPENGIHPFRIKAVVELLRQLTTKFTNDDDVLRQVIVNTHSTVLIKCLTPFIADQYLSVWFSKQNTLIRDISGKKVRLKVTRFQQVDRSVQLKILSTPTEKDDITISDVERFLNYTEVE